MQICWNANVETDSKLFVITFWDGSFLDSPAVEQTITHADIIDDDGSETLNNALFDDIPDGALVTLMLIRANFIQVYLNNENIELADADWESVNNILYESELMHQIYTFASGAMARFKMVLVTEL